MTKYVSSKLETPVGVLTLVAEDAGLAAVLWEDDRPGRVPVAAKSVEGRHAVLAEAGRQLREYFAGSRRTFKLSLAPVGTPFQQKVWAALSTIPFGETRSYGQLARQLGNPAASRAVGSANGRNPLSIIVPCHRVIGSNGKLTGFAGGVEVKAKLLRLEGGSGLWG